MFDGRKISKMAIGTQSLNNDIQSDMFQYFALKIALMSGGINHIDTGFHFRNQSAERVVG